MIGSSLSRRAPRLAALTALAALAGSLLAAAPARAGGLYYADRGVRPLGRAGAFVAGADDPGAITYNPAGMFDAGGQFLFDGSWVNFSSDYARQAQLQQYDAHGKPVGSYQKTFPSVSGKTPVLPIPTLAITFKLHEKLVMGIGVWAPYAALTTYPDSVGNKPAPQRYSLLSLDGSLLAFAGAGLAYAPVKELRLGAVVGMLTGKFNTRANFAGCVPERFLCAPEEPSWDVLAQLSVGPIFAPTGELGALWIPHPSWRVGAAVQLPVYVRSPATLTARLPSTPVFAKATQEGTAGHVAFDLPWMVRAGIETRVVDKLRVELAFNYDRWSMHDSIVMTPDNIVFKNVAGFPATYPVPPVALPRHFQDSVGLHLGGEYTFKLADLDWDARAGVSFETSAIPTAYTSVLTVDQNKVTTALGGSMHWRKLRLDLTYAHVFGFDVNVDPRDARIALTSPVRANPPKVPDYINGGHYAARANVLGAGLTYTFDAAPAQDAAPVGGAGASAGAGAGAGAGK